jgi:hypothetical protein
MKRPQQTSELIDEYEQEAAPWAAVAWFGIKVCAVLVVALGTAVALMLRALRT